MALSDKGVLCLTFDNMGSAAQVGRRESSGPDPREEGLVTGYPRVLDLLDSLGLKATFFIEGWNALHHPEHVVELVRRGHEVGLHGWVHEVFHQLDRVDAERTLVDALAAFRNIGIEPRGFRAPGGLRGQYTLDILQKLGIVYDSSVDDPAVNMTPHLLDGGIANVPWQWPLIDYYHYFMHPEGPRTPAQLEDFWSTQLEQTAANGGFLTFIIHAFVSGVDDERLAVSERVLKKAVADERLEILTASQVADRVLAAQ
ncbi:polysaccharide deacetylase family protein, PEP-CTERM locus subfamily [compost metagenome]